MKGDKGEMPVDVEETSPDPDEGLELRPEIIERLKTSRNLLRKCLISFDEMKRRISQEEPNEQGGGPHVS